MQRYDGVSVAADKPFVVFLLAACQARSDHPHIALLRRLQRVPEFVHVLEVFVAQALRWNSQKMARCHGWQATMGC